MGARHTFHHPQEEVIQPLPGFRVGHLPLSHPVFRHFPCLCAFFICDSILLWHIFRLGTLRFSERGPNFSIDGNPVGPNYKRCAPWWAPWACGLSAGERRTYETDVD
ncbi:hypothetical protein GGI1_08366 [Acidithiobacillus sp. GGI-221]|nr:hypothetical protein GGI1_08366 [Acidithiobacillus sp. GGI-221]